MVYPPTPGWYFDKIKIIFQLISILHGLYEHTYLDTHWYCSERYGPQKKTERGWRTILSTTTDIARLGMTVDGSQTEHSGTPRVMS